MDKTAFTKLGFAAGLLKAAAGDNQPGPMPQQPAPPDSHRKRNVALGAAVLAGGMLGMRHLNRVGGNLAQQAMKSQRATQGQAILGGLRSGDAGVRAKAHAAAQKWQQAGKQTQAPTFGQKAQALGDAAKGKVQAAKSRVGAAIGQAKAKAELAGQTTNGRWNETAATGQRPYHATANNKTEFWANRDRGARRERLISHLRGKRRGALATKAKWMAAGTAGLAGGAIAGATGASRANEAQDSSQPGLGPTVG